jgi:hypothetical protein
MSVLTLTIRAWTGTVGHVAQPSRSTREADVVVHVGPREFNISVAVQGERSLRAMLDEMTKCEVVCANGDRRRTAQRGGFRRLLLARERALAAKPLDTDGAGDRD